MAAKYPPSLVKAILLGIKHQMLEDGRLSELQIHSAGPVAEEPVLTEDVWEEFWDTVNGGHLDPAGVKQARKEELAWVHKSDLYDVVPRSECFEETGRKPVDLKWVDTNKGDQSTPLYRSRLALET